jgi:integrase
MLQKQRGQAYSLTTRQLTNGARMYYARFRGLDGKFGPAKSTGIEDQGKQRDRDKALAWCEQYLAGGQVTTSANMTLAAFGAGFFDFNGTYAQDRLLRGKRYSQEQAATHALGFKNWIQDDRLGKTRLSVIDDRAVSSWQLRLAAAGLAPATIHQRTMTLRILLREAYRSGLMRRPIDYEPIGAKRKKVRGVLTLSEAAQLFSLAWPDQLTMVGNLLSAVTGLRAGEVVGLRSSCIHADHVDVVGTWRPKTATMSDGTKNGKPRAVPVPGQVMTLVRALLAANPWRSVSQDPFVFYSSVRADRPVDQRILTAALHDVLDGMIGKPKRMARKIDFHSWRVFANSAYLERSVPDAMIRSTIGHSSQDMTALYYRPEALAPVRAVQADLADALQLPVISD